MVKSANTNGLLDGEVNTSKYQMVVKEKLKGYFNQDRDFTKDDYQKLAATNSISLINAMQFVKNPFQMCTRVHDMIQEITARIRCLKIELKSRDLTLFNGESWELLIRRWAKLEKDFRLKNGHFDISKIPDIYDCIKYDLQHNQKTLQFKRAHELFMCSKALADIIIPQEYGITKEDRLHIGQNYCTPLLMKIRSDLVQCINEPSTEESTTRLDSKYSKGVASPERFVRTRLYFTSESHIHSLLTMLRYGGLLDEEKDGQWKQSMDFIGACAELNYMSQIVLMMFEDPAKDIESDERFHIELHFSPGAYTSCDEIGSEPKGMGFRPKQNRDTLSGNSTPTILTEAPEECDVPVTSVTPATPDSQFTLTSAPTATTVTYSTTSPETESAGRVHPRLRHCASEPDQVQDLGELQEADLFSEGLDLTRMMEGHKESRSDTTIIRNKKKKKKRFGQPHSPDPNTPEWDWGDDDEALEEDLEDDEDSDVEEEKRSKGVKYVSPEVSPRNQDKMAGQNKVASIDLPEFSDELKSLEKQLAGHSSHLRSEDTSNGKAWGLREKSPGCPANVAEDEARDSVSKLSLRTKTKPIEIVTEPKSAGEEKRSRSLEDSVDTATITEIDGVARACRISHKRRVMRAQLTAYQRNYRTIHLPLGSELVMKPLPAFFFYNQAPRALEGFNNVPLLHPLETLHNNLTFHQVDDFLGRVCATRFPVPDLHALASLASKNRMELAMNTTKVSEFPSSSNSSGGPNSPTMISTPADLLKTLGMYIGIAKRVAESECPTKDVNVTQERKETAELDLSGLALTGSYTITMDSNTSSSIGGLSKPEQCQGLEKGQAQKGQVEGQGEGEGQGKVQGQISDQGSSAVSLGAQDSLEECMAQVQNTRVK
ncbi:inositol hexakisphosphate and diphosphoinositol-pentakisphosphate kinase [Elysia marginata]|uniref:Inositol hexakisphosphate and diphosphoinositol-pentakisphosphate kinase n=1 Tax=Elysia marginata TaxID=1093978 RepID=A0AAV4IXV5_9GAST|nr:inositol hexakisphosphate and diphosphoinositol-pentakisphosphate kinase [Elysia marginata]